MEEVSKFSNELRHIYKKDYEFINSIKRKFIIVMIFKFYLDHLNLENV